MRVIKFRVYDKKYNKMGYPIVLLDALKDAKNIYDWDGLIFMLFTGIKDKNGNEIYESDILKQIPYYKEKSELFIVKFDKFEKCGGCNYQHHGMGFSVGEYNIDHIEIIGNIYENPELLERNK